MNILTVPVASTEFEIPMRTLYSAIREGRLKAEKMGGVWIIERTEIARFAQEWNPKGEANK